MKFIALAGKQNRTHTVKISNGRVSINGNYAKALAWMGLKPTPLPLIAQEFNLEYTIERQQWLRDNEELVKINEAWETWGVHIKPHYDPSNAIPAQRELYALDGYYAANGH